MGMPWLLIISHKWKRRHNDDYNTIPVSPDLKWDLFGKRNNLDELINILTKAEERSMIQISFRTQDPNIKKGTIRNPRQNTQLIHLEGN